MEGIILESLVVEFGVAFTCILVLIAAVTGIFIAGMGEEEKTGVRFAWAEWPLPEKEKVAPAPEKKVRLAA
jgi:hypothetical protein